MGRNEELSDSVVVVRVGESGGSQPGRRFGPDSSAPPRIPMEPATQIGVFGRRLQISHERTGVIVTVNLWTPQSHDYRPGLAAVRLAGGEQTNGFDKWHLQTSERKSKRGMRHQGRMRLK